MMTKLRAILAASLLVLVGLTSSFAQFVEQRTYGGTSGGSNNAQTITIPQYSQIETGVPLRFKAGSANTAAATLGVFNALGGEVGPYQVYKPGTSGLQPLGGGEIQQGQNYIVVPNTVSGTPVWELLDPNAATQVYFCNGSSDTATINTLTASGIHALTFHGPCAVTTLSTFPANFTFQGQNRLADCLITSSATGNIVTLNTAGGDVVRNLCITSSVTRTSGAHILAQGTNITLESLTLFQVFNGLELLNVGSPATACPSPNGNNPCSGLHARDVSIYGSPSWQPNDCVLIDGSNVSPGQPSNTDVFLSDFFCSGGNTTFWMKNGIEVQEAGDVHIDHIETEFVGAVQTNNNAEVLVDPSGGQIVQWVEISHSLLDAGNAHGVMAIALNGASINAIYVDNNWIASNPGGIGVNIATDTGVGSSIVDASIINNHIINNADGINIAVGTNIEMLSAAHNFIVGHATNGFSAGFGSTGTGNWRLIDNLLQTNGVGASFPSITLNSTVAIGNLILSNTTNVSGSPTLTVNANNFVSIP